MNKKLIIVGAGIVAASLTIPTAAMATEQPYTIVAWVIPGGDITKPFAQTQTLFTHTGIATVDLGALDASLLCGTAYQVDVYDTSETTTKLIAGAVLHNPNQPQEDHVKNAGPGYSWKVFRTPDCVIVPEQPAPVAQVVTTSGTFDCDSTTVTDTVTTTYVGHILVDNVWVLNPLPSDRAKVETFDRSLTAEESASLDCAVDVPPVVVPPVTPPVVEPPFVDQQPPTLPATVANPAPVAELAYTGSNDVNPFPYLAIGSLLLAAGAFMATRKKATK